MDLFVESIHSEMRFFRSNILYLGIKNKGISTKPTMRVTRPSLCIHFMLKSHNKKTYWLRHLKLNIWRRVLISSVETSFFKEEFSRKNRFNNSYPFMVNVVTSERMKNPREMFYSFIQIFFLGLRISTHVRTALSFFFR